MAYGYWLIKFKLAAPNSLEVYEYEADASRFIPGATLAIGYWESMHAVCETHHAQFSPPRPDKLAVVSEGVLEGGVEVEGIRYPSPEHMSGWWFITDRYNGDVDTLKTTHMYHVTARRPDIAPYVALPPGFRFKLGPSGESTHVRFDQGLVTK